MTKRDVMKVYDVLYRYESGELAPSDKVRIVASTGRKARQHFLKYMKEVHSQSVVIDAVEFINCVVEGLVLR